MKLSVVLFILIASCTAPTSATSADPLVNAARSQIGVTTRYDPAYRKLDYPGGDVPKEAGVCTDVVIRALRDARGLDLQELVHKDMAQNFSRYPKLWGLSTTDRNIDHRRVPNLQAYFRRMGYEQPVSEKGADYKPGDIVTTVVPPNLPHILIVSDKTNVVGHPLVIHNIGAGTQEEDRLFEFKITGHYRIK